MGFLASLRYLACVEQLTFLTVIGPELLPILHTPYVVWNLFCVVAVVVAATMHAFFFLELEPWLLSEVAYVYGVAMFGGTFEDLTGGRPPGGDGVSWGYLLMFVAMTMTVGLVLMNIMITILGNRYNSIQDNLCAEF